MAEFVLLHGAWHSPWHWSKLVPELEKRGHDVVVVDLPGSDPEATTESFVGAIDAAISDPGETILVAHSAAGLWGSVAAERRPVRELVLLAALLPKPGLSWIEQFADEPLQRGFAAAQYQVLTSETGVWSAAEAAEYFYNDVDPVDVAAAVEHLRPERAAMAYSEKTPLTGRPAVPSRYVWCTRDRAVAHDWAVTAAPERFGARVVEFEASHSPFLTDPAALAELLVEGH